DRLRPQEDDEGLAGAGRPARRERVRNSRLPLLGGPCRPPALAVPHSRTPSAGRQDLRVDATAFLARSAAKADGAKSRFAQSASACVVVGREGDRLRFESNRHDTCAARTCYPLSPTRRRIMDQPQKVPPQAWVVTLAGTA